jgi:hypothetical protein
MHFNRVLISRFHTKLSYQVDEIDVFLNVFVARRWSIIVKTKPFGTQTKAKLGPRHTSSG